MTKRVYETPVLRAHGTVEALTKGSGSGAASDAVFPAGTPGSDVTLS